MKGTGAFLLLLFAYVAAQGGPIVDTGYGPVQGVNVNMASGDVIQTWMGIPFARPPVGELRFEVSWEFIDRGLLSFLKK